VAFRFSGKCRIKIWDEERMKPRKPTYGILDQNTYPSLYALIMSDARSAWKIVGILWLRNFDL
jgi:hypothetical protein